MNYNVFLSYSHHNVEFVDDLYRKLIDAGFKVWYDKVCFDIDKSVNIDIPKIIDKCEKVIFVSSKDTLNTNYATDELAYAKSKRKPIIILKIDDSEIMGFANDNNWIDCSKGLNKDNILKIIKGIDGINNFVYGYDNKKSLYFSSSWREKELKVPRQISNFLIKNDYLLVGDNLHNSHFDEKRIENIMSTCQNIIAILPYREETNTSGYILKELEIAKRIGLKGLILSDSRVKDIENIGFDVKFYTCGDECIDMNSILDYFDNNLCMDTEFKSPHCFLATSLSETNKDFNKDLSELISITTNLNCAIGDGINGRSLQPQITQMIQNSYVFVGDISEDNFNTCIETGIALGANRNICLISKSPRRHPPFMFRDIEVCYYDSLEDLFIKLHKKLYEYRRGIINENM